MVEMVLFSACKPHQLKEVAAHCNVPLHIMKGKRIEFIRELTGKCPKCGIQSDKGVCRSCKARGLKKIDPIPARERLTTMPSKVLVLLPTCQSCGKEMPQTASMLIRRHSQYGVFREVKVCGTCKGNKSINRPRFVK